MAALQFILKTIVTAILIAVIATVSKRLPAVGALIASLPLTSILAMIWLYQDTRDISRISELSYGIFWMVIPSLIFFIILPFLLKRNINFYLSLLISSTLLAILYPVYAQILKLFKIDL